MILVLDIGNTNIKCGLFEKGELIHSFRMETNIDATSDEYGIKMVSFFKYLNLDVSVVKGIIVASVIPSINFTIEHMLKFYFNIQPQFVGPGMKTGINIKTENPKELGADIIVSAVACYEMFGGPCITIDFGTATTYGVTNRQGDFLGVAISPGVKIVSEALTTNAAKLPRVELNFPPSVIGKNTETCMQSGLLYGYVGQIEYIVNKIKSEIGDAIVVATGGFGQIFAKKTNVIDKVVPTLTLIGLNKIYEKNHKTGE